MPQTGPHGTTWVFQRQRWQRKRNELRSRRRGASVIGHAALSERRQRGLAVGARLLGGLVSVSYLRPPPRERLMTPAKAADGASVPVVRGGIEPPTHGFSDGPNHHREAA